MPGATCLCFFSSSSSCSSSSSSSSSSIQFQIKRKNNNNRDPPDGRIRALLHSRSLSSLGLSLPSRSLSPLGLSPLSVSLPSQSFLSRPPSLLRLLLKFTFKVYSSSLIDAVKLLNNFEKSCIVIPNCLFFFFCLSFLSSEVKINLCIRLFCFVLLSFFCDCCIYSCGFSVFFFLFLTFTIKKRCDFTLYSRGCFSVSLLLSMFLIYI